MSISTQFITRKLYSHKRTYLGTLTFPIRWDPYRAGEARSVRFAFTPPRDMRIWFTREEELEAPALRTGEIIRCYEEEGSIMLYGVTPEEFEELRGCSFSPSMAYLRSIIGKM